MKFLLLAAAALGAVFAQDSDDLLRPKMTKTYKGGPEFRLSYVSKLAASDQIDGFNIQIVVPKPPQALQFGLVWADSWTDNEKRVDLTMFNMGLGTQKVEDWNCDAKAKTKSQCRRDTKQNLGKPKFTINDDKSVEIEVFRPKKSPDTSQDTEIKCDMLQIESWVALEGTASAVFSASNAYAWNTGGKYQLGLDENCNVMSAADVYITKQLLAERGTTAAQNRLYTGGNIKALAAEGLAAQEKRYGGHFQQYLQMRPWIIDDEFRWVLLVAVAIIFHYIMTGFFYSSQARSQYLTQEFLTKEFGEEHKAATGLEIKKGGYPDQGSGRYVQRLGYAAQHDFNLKMRVHGNYQETIQQFLFCMIVAGTVTPRAAWIWGLCYLVFRIAYGFAYARGSSYVRYIAPWLLNLNFAMAYYAMGQMIAVFVQQRLGAVVVDMEK